MNEIHRRRAADASAVRVRRQWLRGGVAAGLAAAAIVIATFWTSPRVNWTWSATDVVANSTRGEPATGVGYRVTLAPDTTSHALLFCVTFVDGRQDIERLHPPRPSVLATTQYRNWPSEPFAAGVSVTIPPSWSFGLTTNEGYLLLFTQTDGAFDEPTIEAIETTIRTALRASGRTGTAAIESLALELQADGRQVEWRPIRVP